MLLLVLACDFILNSKFTSNVILITGTPGVGKTSVGKFLQNKGHKVLNLNDFILSQGLYFGYDYSRGSVIIDERKLKEHLQIELHNYTEFIFIEGHTSELVPIEFIKMIFVLRCNPGILRDRLESSRDYPIKKIEENVQAEIMEECLLSVKQEFPTKAIFEIDSSKNSPDVIAEKILSTIK